ncbi:MAG: DUF333 domain-containing protein [Caldilineaceae bacterium]
MIRTLVFIGLMLAGLVLLSACILQPIEPTAQATMPNPASVYCEQNGGKLQFRTDAAGGVAGICHFPDGSECDEWAYFRGECQPGEQFGAGAPSTSITGTLPVVPTEFPTPLPINQEDYARWWTYTNEAYGFSLRLPPDWAVDETTTSDPLLAGHLLNFHPKDAGEPLSIRVTFRRLGEETLLWPTGVGEGEFVPQGTLDIAGQPAQRVLFLCPTGQIQAIWYHQDEQTTNLQRGELEFSFIFGYRNVTCREDYHLDGKRQHVGEMVIASLALP